MKKIIVVFDGEHFPTSALDFALSLNSNAPILLTGIFLPSVYYNIAIPAYSMENYNEDYLKAKKNMQRFKEFCDGHYINFKIHNDTDEINSPDLQHETRFADLMLVSNVYSNENIEKIIQEDYITDLLHKAECSIMLLPEKYVTPSTIIIAYDGSESSMYAIKQFIYLLPEFTELDVHVVYVGNKRHEIPYLNLIKEYAPHYFNKIAFYQLEIAPQKYFTAWMQNKTATMLVSGSFGRTPISELFKKNFLREIIENTQTPMFIAHR